MDLLPSPEQTGIVDSSAAFLAERMSVSRTRELFEGGTTPAVDAAAWSAAAELGWFGLGLPEQFGGIGCGLADEAVLFREIGRVIAPGPFVSSVLAARVAAFGGRQDLADEIAAGRPVGLVIPGALDVVAADGRLEGSVQLIDATDGLALVLTPEVGAIVEVSALADVVPVPCLDATVHLQRAEARRVEPMVSVPSTLDPVERRAHVLIAAMLTGTVEWCRDTSSRHAIDRVQFDRPIGVNQAVKHPCAEMAVQAQLAYAQSLFAALAIDEDRPDSEFQALSAHLTAAEAARFATGATIQVLGGMGFTHEHDAHLYVKRSEVWAQALGGRPTQLARLLALPEPC